MKKAAGNKVVVFAAGLLLGAGITYVFMRNTGVGGVVGPPVKIADRDASKFPCQTSEPMDKGPTLSIYFAKPCQGSNVPKEVVCQERSALTQPCKAKFKTDMAVRKGLDLKVVAVEVGVPAEAGGKCPESPSQPAKFDMAGVLCFPE